MNRTGDTVLLVDGMALLFRAFYATSYGGYIMKTSAGIPTNAVYGFVKYFWDAVDTFNPSHVICCWDMGSRTFRAEKFDGYKANRAEPPGELIPQFDLVKDVVASFGVPNIGLEGYEADDCIGTLSRKHAEQSHVFVLTGDRDMLQLVDENVHVIFMKKGQSNYAVYNPDTLFAETNLKPAQIIDLKGLMGDPSDNYPGVKGIGEKTALKLLQEFESVEGILENIQSLSKSVRNKIESELDMLHLSRDLATIRRDIPIECGLHECVWSPDPESVRGMFETLEFGGLLKLIS
ncbi:5'-3' exonuclease [Ferviditalea candida]|uniref:5'-3' exonuclease n=1 Tax=Ferviditalea candida TaxID=3108399 RepID=A0ABU5ZF33_9BACL|nr:5'-3' exonuclease H3TH domain-containing protein [Paenibacillaceae bacterium T2]